MRARLLPDKGCPDGSAVQNPPGMQEPEETQIRSLSQEDPLEEGMPTHTSILAWRTPWTEEPGGLQSIGSQRVVQDLSNLADTHALSDRPPPTTLAV